MTWRQIRGPKVEFVSDRTVTIDEKQISQSVLLPRGFTGDRTLVFEVRAKSGGQVVTDRARTRISAERLQGEVAPRNRLIAPALEQAPNNLQPLNQIPSPPRLPRLKGTVRLVGPTKGLARPDQKVVLRITSTLRVKKVTWTTYPVTGKPSTLVGGKRFRVTTPAVGEGPLRIQALVRLTRKRTVERSFVLMPKPDMRVQTPIPDGDREKNEARFCELAKSLREAKKSPEDTPVEVKSKDESELQIVPSKTLISDAVFPSPATCSGKGTITFSGGKMQSSAGSEFHDVDGVISMPQGIELTSMKWTLDPEMYRWVPEYLRTIKLKGAVIIGFDKDKPGEWGSVKGTTYLSTPIPFVPLPDGWEIPRDKGAFLQFYEDVDEDDHKGIPEGSIQLVQKAIDPKSSVGSSIEVGVVRRKYPDGKTGWGQVIAAVNNLEVFKTPSGKHVMASRDAVFDIVTAQTEPDSSANQVNLKITCPAATTGGIDSVCPIADDVYFREGILRMSLPRHGVPSTGGYVLSADIAFGSKDSSYILKAGGAYKSKDDWKMEVNQEVTFDFNGVKAYNFLGRIKRSEETVDGEKKVVTTFKISSSLDKKDLEFANEVELRKVAAEITNQCEDKEPDCEATEVKFKMGVDLAIPAPGDKTIDAALWGSYNWKTKGLILRADVGSDTPLGPDGWNFKAGSIFASRAVYGYCQAQGYKERAPNVWAVGFQGSGTMFGADVKLSMQFSGAGSCIFGTVGELDTGGLPTNGVIGSWTSFPKGAMVKLSDEKAFLIKANTGSLKGLVKLPQVVDDFLGSTGKLEFTAEITGKFEGGLFEIAYTGTPPDVANQGSNSFRLSKIALGMSWDLKSQSARLYGGAEGLLTIKGDAGKQIPDSVTPLGVYFAVGADAKGAFIEFSAGKGQGDVQNAFGVAGLTVKELGASGQLYPAIPAVQITFAAKVTVPKAWESSGFKEGTDVTLAFSVGNAAPWCVEFEIGVQKSGKVVLDVANAGYLVASYFRILIAPAGCVVQIGANEKRTIPPGFGLAFDGHIIGAPIIVALNVGLGKGTSSEFTMQGELKMPKLELPLITLSGARGGNEVKVSLDIDTAKRKYDAAIDAGVLVGYPDWGFGAHVDIVGRLDSSNDKEVTFSVQSSADFKMAGAYMRLAPFMIDLAIPKRTLVPSRARVHSGLEFGMFGRKLFNGDVDMAYDQGRLVAFGILVGVTIDLYVGEISGNVAFRYCLGNIGDSQTRSGRLADCRPFQYKTSARPGYRIDLGGTLRALFYKSTYYWNIAEQKGAEGDKKFEPEQPPGPLPGPTADIKPEDEAFFGLMGSRVFTTPLALGTTEVNFRSIRPAKVEVPRQSRTVPPCSVVQIGTEKYTPAAGTYPNAVPLEPVPKGDCGLIGAYLPLGQTGDAAVRTVPIVCSDLQCVADDKPFQTRGSNGSVREARAQILTLLREPPGVLSSGTEIYYNNEDPKHDRGALTGLQSQLRVMRFPTRKVFKLVLSSTSSGATLANLESYFPPVDNAGVTYHLTDRGVLRSSTGRSMGENAALDKAPKPELRPVLALMRWRIVVYCGPTQDSGILWTFDDSGYTKVQSCKPAIKTRRS